MATLAELAALTLTGSNAEIAAQVSQTAGNIVKREERKTRNIDQARSRKAAAAAAQMQQAEAACVAADLPYKAGKILSPKAVAAHNAFNKASQQLAIAEKAAANANNPSDVKHVVRENAITEHKRAQSALREILLRSGVAHQPRF